ncbi:hypothetical protein ACO0QE_000266 [Hanseniaspora vineae]
MPRKSKSKKLQTADNVTDSAEAQKVIAKNNNMDVESDHSTSSEEEEDDFGDLVTEDVESGIQKVLNAIKSNDPSLLNPEVRFFDESGNVTNEALSKSHKPLYLKEYQRSRLLNGELNKDDDDDDEDHGDNAEETKPVKTYAEEQEEDRQGILNEINKAFNDSDDEKNTGANSDKESDDSDDSDDDGFLKKKAKKTSLQKVEDYLPDPEKEGEEEFLKEFMDKQAWIPKKKTEKGDVVLDIDGETIENLDEKDNEEFDEAVEEFENAYNFRYEDPTSAEIVSYARTQATLRRSDTSSRRTKRDRQKQEKEAQKQDFDKALNKKKREKVNKIQDVIKDLEKEYGQEIQTNPKLVEKLTNLLINEETEFDQNQWDQVLAEVFAEQEGDSAEKPTWDEDDEIMADFHASNEKPASHEEPVSSNKKSKRKAKLEAKREGKKQKKDLQNLIENAVEDNKLVLMDEVEEERKSRSKNKETDSGLKFKYREVSPDSFGLTYREIFAADDEALNKFINIKKFAPYRPKNLRDKDRRKVTKSKRMAEWRKEVFNDKNGLASYDGEEQEHKKHKSKKSDA